MSRYELELWAGLSALSSVLRDELRPGDVMQVNMSSRATVGMHLTAAICRLVGAVCRPLGIVSPDEALDSLADGGTTLLSAPPSYLAGLVMAARRAGCGPGDFQLRRIVAGGEILSPSLAQAACGTLGVPRVDDGSEEGIGHLPPDERRNREHASFGVAEGIDATVDCPAHPQRLGGVAERDRLDDEERVAAGQTAKVFGLSRRRRPTAGGRLPSQRWPAGPACRRRRPSTSA